MDAWILYQQHSPKTEAAVQLLIDKYGEIREFTYLMAEYLFHHNTIYGRSVLESKPWLLKSRELDKNNTEVLIHLTQLTAVEQDKKRLVQYISKIDSSSDIRDWMKFKLTLMEDTVDEHEIRELSNLIPPWLINFVQVTPEDATAVYERLKFYLPYILDKGAELNVQYKLHGFQGKERLAYDYLEEYGEIRNSMTQARRCLPATLMADQKYSPFSQEYEHLYEELKSDTTMWGLYASLKYCLALNKGKECAQLKQDLFEKTTAKENVASAKYFYYSFKAFEARMAGDNQTALLWIDSAFMTPPERFFDIACFDKIIMQSEIYEERGEYEKSIARLENTPHRTGYEFFKGYATYRLTEFYEKTGNSEKAIAKCDLFIKDYMHCDEKYKPWYEEVMERQKRLMAKIL